MKYIIAALILTCSTTVASLKITGTFEGRPNGPTFFDQVSGSFEVIFDDSQVESIGGFQYFFQPVEAFAMSPQEIDVRSYDASNIVALIRYLDGSFYDVILESGPRYGPDDQGGGGAGYSGIAVHYGAYGDGSIDAIYISTESGVGVSMDDAPSGSLTIQQTSDAATARKIVPVDSFSNLSFSKTSNTYNSLRNLEDYTVEESWFPRTQLEIDPLKGEVSASGGALHFFPNSTSEVSAKVTYSFDAPVDLTAYDELVLSFPQGIGIQPIAEIILHTDYVSRADNDAHTDGPVSLARDVSNLGNDSKNNLRVALYKFTVGQSGERILPRSVTGISLSFRHTFTTNDEFFSVGFVALRNIKQRESQKLIFSKDGSQVSFATVDAMDSGSVYSFDSSEDLNKWLPLYPEWRQGSDSIILEQRTLPSHTRRMFYRLLHFSRVPENLSVP